MVTKSQRLFGAIERKTRRAGQGFVLLIVSGISGTSFPGAGSKYQSVRASTGTNESLKSLDSRRQMKFYRRQGDNVSLTGLPFQANPTVEIHGA